MNVTEKELAFLKSVVDHNEYGERGCLANRPWSWAVCGTKSKAAVLGSLVKKGLMFQQDSGEDANCGLTEAGKRLYCERFGIPDHPDNQPIIPPGANEEELLEKMPRGFGFHGPDDC